MRTKTQTNEKLLMEAFQEAEKNGPLSSLSALCKIVSELYNKQCGDFPPLNPQVVSLRMNDLNIEIKTQKGRRTLKSAKAIDDKAFQNSIQEAEKYGALPTLTNLWDKVAEIYNQNQTDNVLPSFAKYYAQKNNLEVKTQPGKRGSHSAGKPSTPVDENILKAAVQEAEKYGALPTLTNLWNKVAEIYNQKTGQDVSAATLTNRIKQFNIEYQTQAGEIGRKGSATPVDEEILKKSIKAVENCGPLDNLTALWQAVSIAYNKELPETPITPTIAYLRIQKLELPFITKAGRRGREASSEEPTPKEIKTFDEPTSRRKLCPNCNQYVTNRTPVCACGHEFAEVVEVVVHDPFKRDRIEMEAAAHKQVSGNVGRIVITPAYSCPIKLRLNEDPNQHEEDLRLWISSLVDNGHKNGLSYSPQAIKHFLREFVDINSENYQNLKSLVNGIVRQQLQNLGALPNPDTNIDEDDENLHENGIPQTRKLDPSNQ